MDYENQKQKILEIISNNRRFCKIKDVYESNDKIIIKTIDDLDYVFTIDEFRILYDKGSVATDSGDLYYLHDEIPEGYFDKEMSHTERLWRTLNRMKNAADDANDLLSHYFGKVKYWLHDENKEELAETISKKILDEWIEGKFATALLSLKQLSESINYPDFEYSKYQ